MALQYQEALQSAEPWFGTRRCGTFPAIALKKIRSFREKRFDNAVKRVADELVEIRSQIAADSPAEFDAFLNLHSLILADPILSEEPKNLIQSKLINAEWALIEQMEVLLEQFSAIEDDYFRERNSDVRQVVERILKSLRGHATALPLPPEGENEDPWLIVAHDISPADMVQLKGRRVGAFVTEMGGATSHTAIVARSLGIPAVVGVRARSSMCTTAIWWWSTAR